VNTMATSSTPTGMGISSADTCSLPTKAFWVSKLRLSWVTSGTLTVGHGTSKDLTHDENENSQASLRWEHVGVIREENLECKFELDVLKCGSLVVLQCQRYDVRQCGRERVIYLPSSSFCLAVSPSVRCRELVSR
jgi:hypothetical protein